MQINNIPFGTTDWSSVEATRIWADTGVCDMAYPPVRRHPRATGGIFRRAIWRTTGARRGTFLFCVDVSLDDPADGRSFTLTPGMSYQSPTARAASLAHREGCALFIVD